MFPKPLMDWSGSFYSNVFNRINVSSFALRENDYVFGEQKFAGNAQSFSSDRMLHHTSFLWDFKDEMMEALKVLLFCAFHASTPKSSRLIVDRESTLPSSRA